MEDETRYELERVALRLQRYWVGVGVVIVLVLALAVWNAALLNGSNRLMNRLALVQTTLDSFRAVQTDQLWREQLAAARLADLDSLEQIVQTKASIAAVLRLRRTVTRLASTTARLDSVMAPTSLDP